MKELSNKGSYFKDVFLPKTTDIVGKIGQQRHLAAIRDSFATMMPLIIAGSMGVLVNAIIFGGAGSGYISLMGLLCRWSHNWGDMTGSQINDAVSSILSGTPSDAVKSIAAEWNNWAVTSKVLGLAFGHINTCTIGIISIYFSFLFGYFIAISRNFSNPVITGMVCVASVILSALGDISFVQGAPGLIAAIIISLIASELFIKLSSIRALLIKLPAGVPPAVSKSFAVFLPVVIVLCAISCLVIIVFAPAVATQGLYVSTGNNLTLTLDDSAFKPKGVFDPDKLANLTKIDGDTNNILDQIKSLTTVSGLKNLISRTEGHDRSLLSSYILMISQNFPVDGKSVNSILHPDTQSMIDFIMKDNSITMFIKWQSIKVPYGGFGFAQAVFQFFTSWFIGLATGEGAIGIAILYVTLVSLFWIFGIHGSNLLMGIFAPIFTMILAMNSTLVQTAGSYEAAKATGQMGIFATPFFDSYVFIGGAGSTLTLLVSTFIFSKRRELKEIAKYATPAGCFQINEPVMFGYPIVLNGIYAIPFIFTQMVNVFIAWIFVKTGAVKMQTIQTPWTAPWFIGGVISSMDGKAIIPAFINFGIDILMYVPFVLFDNYVHFKNLKQNDPETYEIEMRYFSDKEYKFSIDTESKYNRLIERGDSAYSSGAEIVKFWEKNMHNKDKFNVRKETVMAKAQLRKDNLYAKANSYKEKQEAKAIALKPKWDAYKEKKQSKNK